MSKPTKKKYRLDKWFLVFMAMLLWTLGNILINRYAFQIPANLTNPSFWLNMVAVIIAIFAWIWLLRIYMRSVRVDDDKDKTDKPPIKERRAK